MKNKIIQKSLITALMTVGMISCIDIGFAQGLSDKASTLSTSSDSVHQAKQKLYKETRLEIDLLLKRQAIIDRDNLIISVLKQKIEDIPTSGKDATKLKILNKELDERRKDRERAQMRLADQKKKILTEYPGLKNDIEKMLQNYKIEESQINYKPEESQKYYGDVLKKNLQDRKEIVRAEKERVDQLKSQIQKAKTDKNNEDIAGLEAKLRDTQINLREDRFDVAKARADIRHVSNDNLDKIPMTLKNSK